MAFRITPSLGPDLDQKAAPFYFDINFPDSPSYPLGSRVNGSDGHEYVFVEAGGTLAAGADLQINETTWVATAGTAGYEVPSFLTGGVTIGQFFHARRIDEELVTDVG